MFDQHRFLRWTAALLCVLAGAAARAEPKLSDPTRPPYSGFAATPAPDSGLLLLRSTHVSGSSRSAVINDHVVSIGSRIGGAEVVAIEPGRVTLATGGERITLTLLLPRVKRPVAARESA